MIKWTFKTVAYICGLVVFPVTGLGCQQSHLVNTSIDPSYLHVLHQSWQNERGEERIELSLSRIIILNWMHATMRGLGRNKDRPAVLFPLYGRKHCKWVWMGRYNPHNNRNCEGYIKRYKPQILCEKSVTSP